MLDDRMIIRAYDCSDIDVQTRNPHRMLFPIGKVQCALTMHVIFEWPGIRQAQHLQIPYASREIAHDSLKPRSRHNRSLHFWHRVRGSKHSYSFVQKVAK